MTYKVKSNFLDKTDNRKLYKKGDPYSNKDDDRIAFLIKEGYLEGKSKQPQQNKQIKHTGGGWYELPNGEKVQGKTEALAKLESGE